MALKLYVDYSRKRLIVLAPNNVMSEVFQLPPWVQNDNVPIEIAVLDDNGAGVAATYAKRNPATYGVRVKLVLSDNTQLAYQATFTADAQNNVYTGNLTADSGNQTTALTAANPSTVYLEIEITSDGGLNYETILPKSRGQTTLEKEAIATAASNIPTNDTAVTVANIGPVLAALLAKGFVLGDDTTGKRLIYFDAATGTIQGAPISE